MTEFEKEQALEYCRKGYTVSEILMILPIEPKELRELVQAENIQSAECVRGSRAELILDVQKGETNVEKLAEKHFLSKSTIHNYVKTGHRKPHYIKSLTNAILEDLQKGDLSQSEIARKYNVSRQAVFKCKKYL